MSIVARKKPRRGSVWMLKILSGALLLAALAPGSAMGAEEPVTLRGGGGEALPGGAPIRELSTNFVFTGESGLAVKCSEAMIEGEVTENPGARVLITGSSFYGGGAMSNPRDPAERALCPVAGSGGNVEAGIQFLEFREAGESRFYTTTQAAEEGEGIDRATVKFKIDYWNRALLPGAPIAVCTYEAMLTNRYNLNKPLAGKNEDRLMASRSVLNPEESSGACFEAEGMLSGSFEISSEGEPIEIHP